MKKFTYPAVLYFDEEAGGKGVPENDQPITGCIFWVANGQDCLRTGQKHLVGVAAVESLQIIDIAVYTYSYKTLTLCSIKFLNMHTFLAVNNRSKHLNIQTAV